MIVTTQPCLWWRHSSWRCHREPIISAQFSSTFFFQLTSCLKNFYALQEKINKESEMEKVDHFVEICSMWPQLPKKKSWGTKIDIKHLHTCRQRSNQDFSPAEQNKTSAGDLWDGGGGGGGGTPRRWRFRVEPRKIDIGDFLATQKPIFYSLSSSNER